MQRYGTSATQGNILEFKDLIAVKIKGKYKKGLIDFLHSWDHTRLYMKQAFSLMYDEQLFLFTNRGLPWNQGGHARLQ